MHAFVSFELPRRGLPPPSLPLSLFVCLEWESFGLVQPQGQCIKMHNEYQSQRVKVYFIHNFLILSAATKDRAREGEKEREGKRVEDCDQAGLQNGVSYGGCHWKKRAELRKMSAKKSSRYGQKWVYSTSRYPVKVTWKWKTCKASNWVRKSRTQGNILLIMLKIPCTLHGQ